jgi:hypothetical protein
MSPFTLATISQRSSRQTQLPLWRRTILIVEDEPLIALDLHAALQAAGAGLIAATNSAEALALFRRRIIALFLAVVYAATLLPSRAGQMVRPTQITK